MQKGTTSSADLLISDSSSRLIMHIRDADPDAKGSKIVDNGVEKRRWK